jgi:hypothetical protein
MIEQYVVGLHEVDQLPVAVVGGKGGQLGRLSRIDGVHVPAGFASRRTPSGGSWPKRARSTIGSVSCLA